ncbi:MAG: carboxypeptidase-like regulatory domain-containing protein [Acidobacteriota bacterium]|nr:carboxypeptidase-like regulatory domain-containing protein [Acidobacteriota bacterium]
MKRLLSALFLTVIFVAISLAQTTSGRLSGTVQGPDGAVPGATVTATDNATGKATTVTADESGNFVIPQLEFGTYTVVVSSAGFSTFTAQQVKIDVGREYTLEPKLVVGDVSANVTVVAGADVVTSTSAQVTNTVSPQQILTLPLITRNPLELTRLQAGTASNPFQGTSINGLRTTFTNITRDGINIQDNFIRTNATDFAPGRPSVDDTGEFTISTSNQEADQGSGGAQIRVVTPRGGKDFHGALFAYNRNSRFQANDFFRNRSSNPDLNTKPAFRNRNQFGGKVSGPMPVPHFGEGGPIFEKNKGFFFFAYDRIINPVSGLFTRTILTPSARSGAFNFTRAAAGSPITTGNIICPSGAAGSICTIPNILAFAQSQGFANIPSAIDPTIQSRVISQLPATGNFTQVGDQLNTTGYQLSRQQNQNRKTYTTRLDLDATEKDSINGVFSYTHEVNLRPDVDANGFGPTPDVEQTATGKTFVMAYRRIISGNIVNEARGGLFTNVVPFQRTGNVPSTFLGGAVGNLITNPQDTFLSQGRNTKSINYQDNVDYILGKHSLKFGGQLQFFKVNSYNDALTVPVQSIGTNSINAANNNTFATSNFANVGGAANTSLISTTQLGTANNLLALLGGLVNGVTQSFNTVSQTSGFQPIRQFQPFRYSNHSVYLADRWTAARGLTLSLGLRYELFPALRLKNGLALEPVIKDLNNPIPSLLDPNGSYTFVGTNIGKPGIYYKNDYNNFAPSIGVAYSPRFESGIGRFLVGAEGKTVVRGGFSVVYGNDSIVTSINNTLSSAATGNTGLGRTGSAAVNNIPGSGTTQLNDRLSNPATTVNPPPFVFPRSFLQNNTAQFGNFGAVSAINPKLQIPRVEQYSAGFQREFFGNTALEIRYVGSRSKNLARGVDLNQVDIFNNGFLADFNRAAANLALPGATTAFCSPTTVTGCQALSIFQSGAGAAGRLGVGTGGLSATTFNNALRNGTPADLAISFITNGVNNAPTVASPTNKPFVNFLANPGTGIIEYFTNDGYYNYNSAQIEIRRRFTQGLYLQANYTFSKNLTNAVGTSQALFEPFLDNNNRGKDYQRADYDQTHVFNFNGIYQLPFGKGKMFLNDGGLVDRVFGGFELSGIVSWSSGAPITFVDTRGTLNRAGRSGRQTANSTLTAQQLRGLGGIFEANGNIYFIDPSIINAATGRASEGYIAPGLNSNAAFPGQVFFNVNPGQTGSLPRAILNGPKYFNANVALLKNIRFTETTRLQLRAEAFNLLNNVNFFNNTQFANINSTSFGQVGGAFDPRILQFAARFEF